MASGEPVELKESCSIMTLKRLCYAIAALNILKIIAMFTLYLLPNSIFLMTRKTIKDKIMLNSVISDNIIDTTWIVLLVALLSLDVWSNTYFIYGLQKVRLRDIKYGLILSLILLIVFITFLIIHIYLTTSANGNLLLLSLILWQILSMVMWRSMFSRIKHSAILLRVLLGRERQAASEVMSSSSTTSLAPPPYTEPLDSTSPPPYSEVCNLTPVDF